MKEKKKKVYCWIHRKYLLFNAMELKEKTARQEGKFYEFIKIGFKVCELRSYIHKHLILYFDFSNFH